MPNRHERERIQRGWYPAQLRFLRDGTVEIRARTGATWDRLYTRAQLEAVVAQMRQPKPKE